MSSWLGIPVVVDRCSDNWARPYWYSLHWRNESDTPIFRLEKNHLLRRFAVFGIPLPAVVVYDQIRQARKEPDQMFPTRCVALTDSCFVNVVPSSFNPRRDASDMALDRIESNVAHYHFDPLVERLLEEARDCLAA